MDPILRAAAIYLALLLIFRISGKRTLSQITTFDFVLLLVVGEATQQAMLGDDFSVTNGILVVTALVGIDIAMSFVKEKVSWFDCPGSTGLRTVCRSSSSRTATRSGSECGKPEWTKTTFWPQGEPPRDSSASIRSSTGARTRWQHQRHSPFLRRSGPSDS